MGAIPDQLSVNQPTKVGWGSESCWFGQEFFGWGPDEKKVLGRKKIKKRIEDFIFHCGFKKKVENGVIFAFFPPFSALGAPF